MIKNGQILVGARATAEGKKLNPSKLCWIIQLTLERINLGLPRLTIVKNYAIFFNFSIKKECKTTIHGWSILELNLEVTMMMVVTLLQRPNAFRRPKNSDTRDRHSANTSLLTLMVRLMTYWPVTFAPKFNATKVYWRTSRLHTNNGEWCS